MSKPKHEDKDEVAAFTVFPVAYGVLAPGAVGAVLEHARIQALEGRANILAQNGLPPEPEGDVIVIACGRDHARPLGNLIVSLIAEADSIRDD